MNDNFRYTTIDRGNESNMVNDNNGDNDNNDVDTDMVDDTDTDDKTVIESEGDTTELPSDETNEVIDRDKRSVTATFVFDDVHLPAINELEQVGIDVSDVLAQQLYTQAEEVVYRTRQEVKYDGGEQR